MKFSDYMRQREEEEREKEELSSDSTSTMQKGKRFSDYMAERNPERLIAAKQNSISNFTDKINSHMKQTNMDMADAANYINKNKDIYNPEGTAENQKKRAVTYNAMKDNALSLMQESWDNNDLDTQTRQQALDMLLDSIAAYKQADDNNKGLADYMAQFSNQDSFERITASDNREKELANMNADELEKELDAAKDNLKETKRKTTGYERFVGNRQKINEAETDIQNIKNEIFNKNQDEALSKLSDESKAAFENYYSFVLNGTDDAGKKALSAIGLYDGYAKQKDMNELKENAKKALEEQGISGDEFDSLYEYYQFQRDSERAQQKQEETLNQYENAGALKKTAMNIGTVLSTPFRGIAAATEALNTAGYHDEYAPLNTNSVAYDLTNYADIVRGATSNDIQNNAGGLADFLYQTGMSTADFLSLLPINAATGGGASLAIMGTNAGTAAAKEAASRGVSREQALLTGLAAGAAETAFEKISLDHFWDIAKNQGKAATRNAFVNILAQAGIEGSEEVFTDIANNFTDKLINGGLSDYYTNMDKYYKSGMSVQEAKKKADQDFAYELGMDFTGGALSGGILAGGATAYTANTGKRSVMDLDSYKEVSEGIDTDRLSYESDEDYQKAMEVKSLADDISAKGEKASDYEKGLFAQAAQNLTTVKSNEYSFLQSSDSDSAALQEIKKRAATIKDITVARAFVSDYKEGMNTDLYTRAFNNFYKCAYDDMTFEAALKANPYIAEQIERPTLQAIYYLGQNQAKLKSEEYASSDQRMLVTKAAQALGVRVQYTNDLPGANGMYKDGIIYISSKTVNPSMVVFSHELTHSLKQTSQEAYTTYENYVIDYFKEAFPKEYETLYASVAKAYNTTDEALIREEIAANATETFMTDAERVKKFVSENQTIAQRIAEFFDNFIAKLRSLYDTYKPKSKSAQLLAKDIEVYEKARDLWYAAVKEKVTESVTKDSEETNKNETDIELKRTRVQFPVGINQYGLTEIIPQNQQSDNAKFSFKGIDENGIEEYETSDSIRNLPINEKKKEITRMIREEYRGRTAKFQLDNRTYYAFLNGDSIRKGIYGDKKSTQSGYHAKLNVAADGNYFELLENSLYEGSSQNKNNKEASNNIHKKNTSWDYFVKQVKIDDNLYNVLINVADNGNKQFVYDVTLKRVYQPAAKENNQPTLNRGRLSNNNISQNQQSDNAKFSLKAYADDIGLRFSDKDGGDIFEAILMGTDDIDYESVLIDDGSEAYRATLDLIRDSARILQDGVKAAGKIKDFNVTKDMARAMATHYLYKYSATFDVDTLTDNLFNIFAYIQKTDQVDYQDMIRVMQEVCKPVIATSQNIDKDMLKQYNDFRKTVKGYSIKLNTEQKEEIASVYDSFNKFKNVNQNKYTFRENGSYLDNVWSEIVEASGYSLAYDTPVSEQMLALHEYMTSLENAVVSPAEDMNNSQLAYDMALNIYTDYFRLVGEDKQALKNIQSQMQKKLNEYKHDIREDYKDRFKKYKEDAEYQKQDEINRLKNQIRQLERERDDAMYEADDIAVKLLDGDIAALEYKIGKVSKKNAEKLAKLNVQNYNRSIHTALSKQQTELKNHIKKNMFDLQKRLATPNDNRYIPKELVVSTIDLCEAVNIDSGRSEKLSERLSEMSRLYAKMKADKDYAIASEYDEHTHAMINRLQEVFKGRNITMLNMQELKEVDDVITQLRHQIINTGKLIREDNAREVYKEAEKCMAEINASTGYRDDVLGRLLNKYETMSLNAHRQFRRMSGYKTDSVLEQVFQELDEGQLKQTQVLMETARMFDAVLEGKQNQRAVRVMTGKDEKDWIDIGLHYKDQSPVMVPRAFRVSLAMHIQNKSNLDHIIYGGLTIPEMKAYMRGDYETAYKQGRTVKFIPEGKLSKEQREQAYKEAKAKLLQVATNMTPYEKAFLKLSEKFFHEYTTEKINETSLKLNGYKKAKVHNYFPIKTDANFTHAEIATLVMNGTLEGMGMLNSRVGARNPILLEDITAVIERQSKNVAKYYGLAIPVRNFKKIYNVTLIGYRGSTKEVIAKKWGVEGQKYIENLLTDLESHRGQDNTFFDKLRGAFASATLTTNFSVTIKQAASFPTAAYTVGWDALGHAFPKFAQKVDMDLIAKYSPLLWYRNQGNSTQELGDIKKSGLVDTVKNKLPEGFDKLPDALLNWIQAVDTKTVGTLWKACEYRVEHTQSSLTPGTDAFYKEVAKLFNQCVEDTQPNYTVLQQADISRNPNKLVKQWFMFKTQPMQNFGILYDATMNLRAKSKAYKATGDNKIALQEYTQAKEEFARAISSQLAAAATFSAMTFLAAAVKHKMDRYRDDKDDITLIKTLDVFLGDMLSCISGSFIGGSELYSVLYSVIRNEKYYGIELSVLQNINDITESIVKLRSDVSKDVVDMGALKKDIQNIAFGMTTMFGVPAKNIYQLFEGVGLHIEDALHGEFLSFNAGVESTRKVQYTKLLDAMLDQDKNAYEKQYDKTLQSLMLTKGKEKAEKEITSGIKEVLKEMYLAGEISQDQTESILKDLGVEDKDIYFTTEKWDNTGNDDYSKYAALEAAVQNKSGVEQELKRLTDNGIENDTAVNKLMSIVKEAYLAGTLSEKETLEYLSQYRDITDDDDIYWKLREWNSGDSYYKKYGTLYEALENGTFEKAVKEYTEHGVTASQIKSAINSVYKEKYMEAYLSGEHKTVDDIKVKLNKLKVNGKRLYGANDYLDWNREAKQKK